jgi:poly(ADP-ribose) glycohydrolase ARH3
VRVVALACAYHDDVELVAALAEDATGVTHAHPSARAGAVAHALALAHVLRWSDPERVDPSLVTELRKPRVVVGSVLAPKLQLVLDLLARHASSAEAAHALGNGVLAEEAVPLALFCFLRWAPDFVSVVRNTVLAGGDTDTIAAMSGALCGAMVGEARIPVTLLERIETGPKRGDYVASLADAVFGF